MLCLYGCNCFDLYIWIYTMYAHTISYYCYHQNYFIVCALQVINTPFRWLITPLPQKSKQVQSFDSNEWNFLLIWLFPYYYSLTLRLQDALTILYFSILSPSYYIFKFEVTLFFVDKIFAMKAASQVVLFIIIKLFQFIFLNDYNGCSYNQLLFLLSSLFYRLCIVVHKLHPLVNSFHHRR